MKKKPLSGDTWSREVEAAVARLPLWKRVEFQALRRQFEGSGQLGLPTAVRLGRRMLRRWKK